jgi:hypothetical protein
MLQKNFKNLAYFYRTFNIAVRKNLNMKIIQRANTGNVALGTPLAANRVARCSL